MSKPKKYITLKGEAGGTIAAGARKARANSARRETQGTGKCMKYMLSSAGNQKLLDLKPL